MLLSTHIRNKTRFGSHPQLTTGPIAIPRSPVLALWYRCTVRIRYAVRVAVSSGQLSLGCRTSMEMLRTVAWLSGTFTHWYPCQYTHVLYTTAGNCELNLRYIGVLQQSTTDADTNLQLPGSVMQYFFIHRSCEFFLHTMYRAGTTIACQLD